MKIIFIFILLSVFNFGINISIAQIAVNCSGYSALLTSDPVGCDDNPWYLVYQDNFNGSSLDNSKWVIPYQGVIRNFNHLAEKQWYANTGSTPSIPISNNIEVSNGTLKLIARKETTPINGVYIDWSMNPPPTTSSSFEYSSAEINSKFMFGYGKYEIRCKIPKGKGFWPAFWTYNDYQKNEIDVFEFWNETNCLDVYKPERLSKNPHFNIHNDYNNDATVEDCGSDLYGCAGTGINNATDYSLDFHVFTLIYDFYKIEWYIDGQLKRSTYRFMSLNGGLLGCSSVNGMQSLIIEKAFPIKEYQTLMANLAIQAGSGLPDSETIFPNSYEIDYIKYYKRIPCNTVISVDNIDDLNLTDGAYNVIAANNITFSSNFTIPSNLHLEVFAADEINLLPGFSTINNGSFSATIDPALPCSYNKNGLMKNQISDEQYVLNTEISTHAVSNDQLSIYPNPTNNFLVIEFNHYNRNNSYNISIFDIQGIKIFEDTQKERKYSIDVSNILAGTYILTITDIYTNTVIKSEKVIIK